MCLCNGNICACTALYTEREREIGKGINQRVCVCLCEMLRASFSTVTNYPGTVCVYVELIWYYYTKFDVKTEYISTPSLSLFIAVSTCAY